MDNEIFRMELMMSKIIEELRQFYPGVFSHKNRDTILKIIKESYRNTGNFTKDSEKMKNSLTSLADKLILLYKEDGKQLDDEDYIGL
jgi:hypothetical protein